MTNLVQLVIYSPDAQEYSSLRGAFQNSENLIVAHGSGPQVTKQYNLDAIFVTGMHTTYWGLQPFQDSRAEVGQTPKDKLALGLPPLFVAGLLMKNADSATHGQRYARLLLDAVDRYNKAHVMTPILRVGSIPEFLGLKGEHAGVTAKALKSMFREQETWPESPLVDVKLYA